MAGEGKGWFTGGLIDFARRRPAVVIIVVVLVGLYFGKAGPGARSQAVLVPEVAFSDPSLITHNHTTYVFGVDPRAPGAVGVLSSRDRRSWRVEPSALRVRPAWVDPGGGLGPAAVGAFDGGFVLYYTAPVRGLGIRCVSAATSDSVRGPFVDTSLAPFICQPADGGSTDPSPFVDDSGNPYLAWTSPGSGPGSAPTLWAQRLRGDGLVFTGGPAALLRPSLAWEQGRIADPSMVVDGGRYRLLYTAAPAGSAQQVVASASCAGPLGPCRPAAKPLLAGGTVGVGPGGAHAFTDARDRWWVGLHSWASAPDEGPDPVGRFVVAPLDVTKDSMAVRTSSLTTGRIRARRGGDSTSRSSHRDDGATPGRPSTAGRVPNG